MVKFFEATDYPNIFNKTYWGNFEATQNDSELVKNRNKFVHDYDISSICSIQKVEDYKMYLRNHPTMRKYFDHLEAYMTNDDMIIIVNSPYDHILKYDVDNFKKRFGFDQIYPLYDEHAITLCMRTSIDQIKQELKAYK